MTKNPVFGPFLVRYPNFGDKKFFSGKSGSVTQYGFLAPCQNLEKTNNKIPRKRPDRETEGRTDSIS